MIEHLRSAIALYCRLNVQPPVAAMMTLLSVGKYEFAARGGINLHYTPPFDRDDLSLPGTLIQDFSQSPIDILRPIFDALWNAAGYARWSEYDEYKKGS
jgi:hypothetical protein